MEDVKFSRDLGGLPDMRQTNFEPHSLKNLRHTSTPPPCGTVPHDFRDHARLVVVGFLSVFSMCIPPVSEARQQADD